MHLGNVFSLFLIYFLILAFFVQKNEILAKKWFFCQNTCTAHLSATKQTKQNNNKTKWGCHLSTYRSGMSTTGLYNHRVIHTGDRVTTHAPHKPHRANGDQGKTNGCTGRTSLQEALRSSCCHRDVFSYSCYGHSVYMKDSVGNRKNRTK